MVLYNKNYVETHLGGLPGVRWGSLTGEVFLKLSKSSLDELS